MQSYTCYAIIITTLPDGCHFVSFYYKLVFLILAQLLVIPRTDLPVSLYRPILQIHCRKSLSVTHTLPAIFQRVRRRRTPAKTEDEDQAFRVLFFLDYTLSHSRCLFGLSSCVRCISSSPSPASLALWTLVTEFIPQSILLHMHI